MLQMLPAGRVGLYGIAVLSISFLSMGDRLHKIFTTSSVIPDFEGAGMLDAPQREIYDRFLAIAMRGVSRAGRKWSQFCRSAGPDVSQPVAGRQ